jgi:hypothetical protein
VSGNKAFWGVVAFLVVVYLVTVNLASSDVTEAANNSHRTLETAMFVAQDKMERHFEKADRFSYRNLELVKYGAQDVICGEMIPIGTPPLGIFWSRFVLFVDGNHGYFGGDEGGFEFRRRYEKQPIDGSEFNSVWKRICSPGRPSQGGE